MIKKVRLRIYGVVQGVGFRNFVRQKASSLGLAGYARNVPDGSVEVVLEGDEEAVDAAIDACKIGPPSSIVARVDIETLSPSKMKGFRIE